jgi:hypothetical protein
MATASRAQMGSGGVRGLVWLGRGGLGRAHGLGPVGKDKICFFRNIFQCKTNSRKTPMFKGMKNTKKILVKFPEIDWNMNNRNKIFGAHEKILEPSNRNRSKKNENKFQKSPKNSRKDWTAPKRIFETICTQEASRCIGMNATLTTFYLIQKIKQGFFLYYISCKEK